jgi:hypothetical protein
MAKGETAETIAARVNVQLIAAEWETIRAAVNNGAAIPTEASKEVVMGYHYALCRQGQQLAGKKRNQKKVRISRCSKQNATRGV